MIRPGWALLLPAWLVFFCIQISFANPNVIKLEHQAQWTLTNIHGYNNISIDDVTVPSYVLDTLQQRGLINSEHDLAYRFNERDLAWVAKDTWTYIAMWEIDSNLIYQPNLLEEETTEKGTKPSSPAADQNRHHQRALLILHGIDTAAAITLNNHLLGSIANSHRRYVFDITESILQGVNVLEINIQPAASYAAAQAAAYPTTVPYTKQVGNTGQYNFIRKAASDFGWDWGPSFAPAGISDAIEVVLRTSGGGSDGGCDGKKQENSITPCAAPVYLMDLGLRQHHSTTNESILVTVDAFFRPLVTSAELETLKRREGRKFTAVLEIKIFGPSSSNTDDGEEEPSLQSTWSSETQLEFSLEDLSTYSEEAERKKENQKESADWVIQRSAHVLVTPPFELWWPWDLGTPVLYNVVVTFKPSKILVDPGSVLELGRNQDKDKDELEDGGDGDDNYHQIMHQKIGFRTVELIQDPIIITEFDKITHSNISKIVGETFYFKINQVPIFARGANIVPLDLLPTKVTIPKIKHAVASARTANMNFLRVWGGGRYFPDLFYQECDEKGILVWQEFMYACAMYPTTEFYLHEAAEEARQQVLRINRHPSVVIWGGNNENEAAFTWFPETKKYPERYRHPYEVLFFDVLRDELLSLDPGAVYVDSSPSNGLIQDTTSLRSKEERKKRWGDVTDPSQGDVHFYDYSSNLLDPTSYPPAKFVSEFGYMSLPSFDSFVKQSKNEDLVVGGELVKYRMRHAGGLEEIEKQLQMHFRVLSMKNVLNDRSSGGGAVGVGGGKEEKKFEVDRFQAYIYLTQLQQALIYDIAATTWRLGKNDPFARTAGLLYWQLNDVWAGPSWSSTNYDGKWKVLHYSVRRFFSPVAVFGRKVGARNSSGAATLLRSWKKNQKNDGRSKNNEEEEVVEVWIVNDGREDMQGSLEIYAVPFQSTSALERIHLLNFESALTTTTTAAGTVTAAAGSNTTSSDINVPGSGSIVAWRSNFSETQWGSVQAASSEVYLQLRFCTSATANTKNNNKLNNSSSGGCVDNVMLLGELKDSNLTESVEVEAAAEELKEEELEGVLSSSGSGGGFTSSNTTIVTTNSRVFEVTVTAQGGVALYVFLETPFSGIFSDNLLMVTSREPQKILFFLAEDDENQYISNISLTKAQFSASLRVMWLQKALNYFPEILNF